MYRHYVSQKEWDEIVNAEGHEDSFPHCSTTTWHRPSECPFCDSYYRRNPNFAPSSFATPYANGWGGNMAPVRDDVKAAEEEQRFRDLMNMFRLS